MEKQEVTDAKKQLYVTRNAKIRQYSGDETVNITVNDEIEAL